MTDWSALDAEPTAPLVGPFPRRTFLEPWRNHRPAGDLSVLSAAGSAVAVVVVDGVLRFAGDSHLTDYHSPLGADVAALGVPLADLAGSAQIVLDSLPIEAADPLETGLTAAGLGVVRSDDEACMILDVSESEDGWEAALGSKDRHEVRRKRRRYESMVGPAILESDPAAFGSFVDLHRSAPGDKGGFMTKAMSAFFEDLLAVPGARLDVLRAAGGQVVAAAFGFEDAAAYYLYNSAFDYTHSEASPGIVLVDRLIQQAAASGRTRFDFLKGGETYKRRMGGRERPLFRLEVAV
jgi:CelD/BcsL family acetyltransferase involved in cellulose biosynthesis